jgi:uncharacterized protein (DUF1800 family)
MRRIAASWCLIFPRPKACVGAFALALTLVGCGGGGSSPSGTAPVNTGQSRLQPLTLEQRAAERPATTQDAFRFLRQATFGPRTADLAALMSQSYGDWIDQQFAQPLTPSHLATVQTIEADLGAVGKHPDALTYSWWGHALYDPAQLRHRLALAWSEIFVVSNRNLPTDNVASYLDLLTRLSGARYRDLLEAVTLHPAMGQYLSMLNNRKADPDTGRLPDENYAREVMQLFSIGLDMLDDHGLPTLDAQGQRVPVFGPEDVQGLAQVFTGWSWARPADVGASVPWWDCTWRAPTCQDPSQMWVSMQAYPALHATAAKRFLGQTVATQAEANPAASLKAALDRLAEHPNTAPFISRQLIQKLVTSNPSARYVADVVKVWRDTGGQMQAVVRAILLHDEARHPELTGVDLKAYGKVNEPVLRLTQVLRALDTTSDRYLRRMSEGRAPYTLAFDTEAIDLGLGQTPMRSPSVFNFYRPTYSPSGSALKAQGLVAPEMQLASETTTQSWPNMLSWFTIFGWGQWNADQGRQDLQMNLAAWLPLADQPEALIDQLALRLLGQPVERPRKLIMLQGLQALPIDTPQRRLNRVRAAIVLMAVCPELIVQR